MRSMARLRRTIEKVAEGAIGEVIMVKAQRHASADLPHDPPRKTGSSMPNAQAM
jgi:hypothetical protein